MSYRACWSFLILSILVASIGLTILKWFNITHPRLGLAAMYLFLTASYFFRAKAVIRIPVGVAYAVWEAAGLAIVIIVGIFIFEENFGFNRVIGLGFLLCGSYLIHRGTCGGELAEIPAGKLHPQESEHK